MYFVVFQVKEGIYKDWSDGLEREAKIYLNENCPKKCTCKAYKYMHMNHLDLEQWLWRKKIMAANVWFDNFSAFK